MKQPKLPRKIKARWLKDLRSGKFKQGTGVLVTNYGATKDGPNREFCCLGVLATQWYDPESKGAIGKLAYNTDITESGLRKIPKEVKVSLSASPPVQLKKAANRVNIGLDPEQTATTERCLVELNDAGNKSFKQIANYIERYL